MATTTVTPDHGTIVSEIDIAAPCERVFKALIDAEETRRRSPQLSPLMKWIRGLEESGILR